MGSSFSSSTRSRTRLVSEASAVGISQWPDVVWNRSSLNFGQLRHAEHRLVAQHVGRVDFRVAVMLRMQINHEQAKGPFELGKLALENDKTRTRQFGRRFKIHEAKPFTDIEMLARLEIEPRFFTPGMKLLVVVFVLAFRHTFHGKVRDHRKGIIDLLCKQALGFLARGDEILEPGNLRLEGFGLCLVPCPHHLADFLRQRIAPRLRILKLLDVVTLFRIDFQKLGRLRWQAAQGKALIEGGGIIPDGFDVMHRRRLSRLGPWPGGFQGIARPIRRSHKAPSAEPPWQSSKWDPAA